MKRIAAALLFSCFAGSALFAQTEKLIYEQLVRPQDAVFYHVPIGLCEDYPEETTTLQIIRNDMELLKRSGINLLRISFGWDGIQPAKDQYTWGFWDDYVRIAVEEYGVTLLPYVCYTPMWNSTGDSLNYWNHTPRDYEPFGRFMTVLVNRYKKWIKTWELWNEPDISAYWSGTPEDLARLTKIGAQAVRAADPQAKIVLAGLAHDTNFLLKLFRDYGISSYVDIVNCHNYYETWSGQPLEHITEYVNTIADIVRQYGNHQSIWMAEVGYSTYRSGAHVSDSYTAYYDYEHTPKYQAVHLVRTLTLLLATEKLAAVAWYEVKDLPAQEQVIGDVNNRHLGVATVDYEPKPAERTLSFFTTLFSQKSRCIDKLVTVSKAIGSDSELHCFENEDGSVIVVGWLKTHIIGGRGPDRSGNVKDTRREFITVSIPMELRGSAVQYDELGRQKEFGGVALQESITEVRDAPLVGGEVFILKISK